MLGQVRRRTASLTGAAVAPTPTTAPPARSRQAARRRWLVPFAPGALVPLLLLTIGTAFALSWDGVYPGVRANGLDLGGLSRQEAAARIAADAARWEARPLTLTAPGATYSPTRAELGLRYDRAATLDAAFTQGRGGGTVARLSAILNAAWHGRAVAMRHQIDAPVLSDAVRGLAGSTDVQPRDGDLRIEGGRVVITPAVEGRGLDLDAAAQQIVASLDADAPTTLALPVAERLQPRINDAVLAEARARAEALLAAPIELAGADLALDYDAAAIGAWLVVQRDPADGRPLAVAVDPAPVRAAIEPLAPSVRREPRDATYAFDPAAGGFIATTPALDGRTLDTDATVAAVIAALEGRGPRLVRPATRAQTPALSTGDIAAASAQARQTYLAGPLTLGHGDRAWTLPVEKLAGWLTIEPAAGGARLVFDTDALSGYINGLQKEIERPAVDATYTMDDGSDVYRVTGPSQVGLRLDGPAAYRAAIQALRDGGDRGRALALPVNEIRPKVTEADVVALEPERWVEVDLTRQRMYAMIGKKRVYTAVISSGKRGWEMPTGTFHIMYRVENETMTSESIGAEEYYVLKNVLYTQYFTDEGHALHYSWWKTPESFGTPSSHGCLSETFKDAEYFWQFAGVGTRVTIYGRTPL